MWKKEKAYKFLVEMEISLTILEKQYRSSSKANKK